MQNPIHKCTTVYKIFECLKFTSVSWTVNVWIALDVCVYFWDYPGSELLPSESLVLFSQSDLSLSVDQS